MSYILDALKRADAERERGAVPGLHARQVMTPAPPTSPSTRNHLWLAVSAALALGGIAAGLWVWRAPASGPSLAAVETTVVPPPLPASLAQPTPAPAPAPTPAPAVAVAAPRAAAPSRPPVHPSTPTPAARPTPPAHVAEKHKAQPKPPPATVAETPATQATSASIPLLSELSEDTRRQIPPLNITGAVYAKNPAQRLLLVNGQVLTQGSTAAPDVTLEEIQARSSVFSFRGTRFQVAH